MYPTDANQERKERRKGYFPPTTLDIKKTFKCYKIIKVTTQSAKQTSSLNVVTVLQNLDFSTHHFPHLFFVTVL